MARPPDPAPLSSARRSTLRGVVAAGVIGVSLALTACTGSTTTAADRATEVAGGQFAATTAAAAAAMATEPVPAGQDSGEAGSAAGAASPDVSAEVAPVVAPGDARQIIRTADVGVRLGVPTRGSTEADTAARTVALSTAVSDARAAVIAAGGVVASSDGSGDRTTLGLRIPVEAYDATLDRLAGLGEVQRRTESSQDVTAELVDVAGRIQTMTASVDRVRALLAQATDLGQVVTIEGELARREADLEALQRQHASLAGQVALSTVTLTLTAVTTGGASAGAAEREDTGFLAGLSGGWSALLGLLSGVGTAAGALLPFLPLLVGAGAVIWWVRRRRQRAPGRVASPVDAGPASTG